MVPNDIVFATGTYGVFSNAMDKYFEVVMGVLILITISVWYFSSVVEKPRLLFSPAMSPLVSKCKVLDSWIYHTVWALSGHIQSMLFVSWPHVGKARRQQPLEFVQEIIPLGDGGQVALDWFVPVENNPCAHAATSSSEADEDEHPIVLLLPGVVGKTNGSYAIRLCQELCQQTDRRWRYAVKSWRGIGCPVTAASPRSETGGIAARQDVIEVAEHIRSKHPSAPLLLVGFSYGGQVAIDVLASDQGGKMFSAGIAVSAPMDPVVVFRYVEKLHWLPYSWLNTKSLIESYRESGSIDLISDDLKAKGRGDVFGTLDHLVTFGNLATHLLVRRPYASLWHEHVSVRYTGHVDAHSYLQTGLQDVKAAMQNVKVPMLCFIAEDDPLVPPCAFEHLVGLGDEKSGNITPSPKVVVAITRRGGHCGWFEGLLGNSWIDNAIFEFLQSCLHTQVATKSTDS